jgi:hypothetical protein
MRLDPSGTDGASSVVRGNSEEVPNSQQRSGQGQESEPRYDECAKHARGAALRRRIGVVGRAQPIARVSCPPLLRQSFDSVLCSGSNICHAGIFYPQSAGAAIVTLLQE